MQGFLISSFFCFIAGFSLIRNGSPSKTKGEGRETLLGLMKVLGFCNSFSKEFFFVFEKVWASSIAKEIEIGEKIARCYSIGLLLEKFFS